MRSLLLSALLLAAGQAVAGPPAAPFASIDGGTISLADFAGRPVLIANTASLCGFTPQYDALQALHDAYGSRGLVVLAVPSNDFAQELGTGAEVQAFCEANFDLTLPMTDITPVRGPDAHPVYRWISEEAGWQPGWNFNKVLISRDGEILGTWGSSVDPMGRLIRRAVETALRG